MHAAVNNSFLAPAQVQLVHVIRHHNNERNVRGFKRRAAANRRVAGRTGTALTPRNSGVRPEHLPLGVLPKPLPHFSCCSAQRRVLRARSCDERVACDAELHGSLVQPPAALDWRALDDAAAKMQELGRSVVGDEAEAAALV